MEHIHRDIKKEIKATIEILKDKDMMEQIIDSERNIRLGKKLKKLEF